MKKLVKGTWVVVADEDKGLVLANAGTVDAPELVVVQKIEAADLLAANDRSARGRDHTQSETVAPPDYHRMAGATLARALAEFLGRADSGFEQLVLVASPQVLGALRAALTPAVKAQVVAELAKTLTDHPLPKIAKEVVAALDAS